MKRELRQLLRDKPDAHKSEITAHEAKLVIEYIMGFDPDIFDDEWKLCRIQTFLLGWSTVRQEIF